MLEKFQKKPQANFDQLGCFWQEIHQLCKHDQVCALRTELH